MHDALPGVITKFEVFRDVVGKKSVATEWFRAALTRKLLQAWEIEKAPIRALKPAPG